MNRTIELLRLVQSCARIDGRKKLQKMVHILKEAGYPFDYRYRFHFHGPFSAELKGEIDILSKEELISEEESATGFGDFRQYTFKASPAMNNLLNEMGLVGSPAWEPLAKSLNAKSAQELEAISTIIFLVRNGAKTTDLRGQFKRLKPQLESVYDSAASFANGILAESVT